MFTDSDSDRGQVGIGTLIIFIALVLVAAVAAGVLINTAGFLQSSAESTGSEAQSQVSNQIDVVSASGGVGDDAVDNVTVAVKKSPGSDPIDLEDSTIQFTSDNDDITLVHDSVNEGDGDEENNVFSTSAITDSSDTVLANTSDRVEVTVHMNNEDGEIDSENGNNIDADALDPDSGVTLRIVDQSGATTVYGVNVPSPLGDRDVVMV